MIGLYRAKCNRILLGTLPLEWRPLWSLLAKRYARLVAILFAYIRILCKRPYCFRLLAVPILI